MLFFLKRPVCCGYMLMTVRSVQSVLAVPLRLGRAHPDGQRQDRRQVRSRGLSGAYYRQPTHLSDDHDAEQEREQADKAGYADNQFVRQLFFPSPYHHFSLCLLEMKNT